MFGDPAAGGVAGDHHEVAAGENLGDYSGVGGGSAATAGENDHGARDGSGEPASAAHLIGRQTRRHGPQSGIAADEVDEVGAPQRARQAEVAGGTADMAASKRDEIASSGWGECSGLKAARGLLCTRDGAWRGHP